MASMTMLRAAGRLLEGRDRATDLERRRRNEN